MVQRRKIDVVVAGHLTIDVTPTFTETGGATIEEIFIPGKLNIVGRAAISTGGPVSNTGFALLRLGIKTELMGKVGDDFHGMATMAKLKELGKEKGTVVVKGEESSYTIVIAPPGIDRMFLHNPGANDTFGFKDINFSLVKQSKLFHLGYPPLMKRLYTNGGRELKRIFKKARGVGTTTSMDVALPDPASPSGQADWDSILKVTLPYVDIFLPSAEEAMFMLDKKRFLEKRRKAKQRDILDYFEAGELSRLANRLLCYGANIVGIKCGYRGLYLRTATKGRLAGIGFAKPADLDNWSNRELWEPSYHVRKVISAAGSGDSCIAGFLAAYIKGESVESTLQHACAVGAQNVQALDTISGVKSWKETTRQIKSGWAKNRLIINEPGWKFDAGGRVWRGPGDYEHSCEDPNAGRSRSSRSQLRRRQH